MKKLVTHPAAFAVLYTVLIIPTYILPFLGSNSGIVTAVAASSDAINPATIVHLLCFVGMLVLAWLRGSEIDKKWLLVFPFLALCFDFLPVLSIIPLIPTFLHLLTIILGVIENRQTSAGGVT